MKRFNVLIIYLLLVCVSIFVLYGCTNDSQPGIPPTVEETRETFQSTHIGYPPGEEEAYLEFAGIFFIDLYIQIASLYLDLPGWQGSDGTYTVSISGEGTDITLTIRIAWDTSREMWHYTLTIDGTIEPETYDNFDIFDMYATADGTKGEIVCRDPDAEDNFLSVSWEKGSPYYTFTLTAQNGSDSFTVTLVETPPIYDPGEGVWTSERGRVRIEETENPVIVDASWGEPPPPPFD